MAEPAAALSCDELARECVGWLDARDLACAPASRGDEGTGIAVVHAQIEGRSFIVECRGRGPVHPSRAHVLRLARFMRHGSRVLSVRSALELQDGLRKFAVI